MCCVAGLINVGSAFAMSLAVASRILCFFSLASKLLIGSCVAQKIAFSGSFGYALLYASNLSLEASRFSQYLPYLYTIFLLRVKI